MYTSNSVHCTSVLYSCKGTVHSYIHHTIAITPAQHHTIAITPAQHHMIAITPAQHHTIAITPVQHNTIAITFAQHHTITITSAQHHTIAITPRTATHICNNPRIASHNCNNPILFKIIKNVLSPSSYAKKSRQRPTGVQSWSSRCCGDFTAFFKKMRIFWSKFLFKIVFLNG